MGKFRPLILVLALGACTSSALSANKPKAPTSVAPTPTPTLIVETTDPGDGPWEIPSVTSTKVDTPHWPSVHSHVGGLPVPQGWKLIERKADGYLLDETYESPDGVSYEQVLLWYLARFHWGKTWGGWTSCFGLDANGDAGMYEEPEWWAWRNPKNTDHMIQLFLGGAPHRDRVAISLQRNDWGSACHV